MLSYLWPRISPFIKNIPVALDLLIVLVKQSALICFNRILCTSINSIILNIIVCNTYQQIDIMYFFTESWIMIIWRFKKDIKPWIPIFDPSTSFDLVCLEKRLCIFFSSTELNTLSYARSHQPLGTQINIRLGVLYIIYKLFKYFRGPPNAQCSLEV